MKLQIRDIGLGLINAQNNDVMLVGGMRCGNSPADKTRRRYTIYDKEKWLALSKEGLDDDAIEKACNVGIVDLFVKDGQEDALGATGLVNIEVKKAHRRNGIAGRVVSAIRETTGNELKIHDIKKHVAPVWRKLGVTDFQDGNGNSVKVSKMAASRKLDGVMPPLDQVMEKKKPVPKEQEDEMGYSM